MFGSGSSTRLFWKVLVLLGLKDKVKESHRALEKFKPQPGLPWGGPLSSHMMSLAPL